jgi:hypothetical protein
VTQQVFERLTSQGLRGRSALPKVYEVDPLCCPRCGTQMKPVALIVDEQELARICRHQGQAPGIPKAAPARAPPQSEFCFD